MADAVIAGAVAGAIAGAIAGLAVWLVSHGLPRRGEGRRVYTWRGTTMPAQTSPQYTHGASSSRAPVRLEALSLDPFDESGKRVMAAAREEAIRANHNYIGTEHLLAGVLRGDPEGPAGRALARLDVSLEKVRTALEFIIGRGEAPVTPAEITLSPRTKKVLELAHDEAVRLGHPKIGSAEILIALVREGEGIAAGILESLGCSLEAVRDAVLNEMGTGLRSPAPGTPPPQPMPPEARHRTGPFDRFNDRAKRVLALAQDEAIRFNHNYIGPEHLLLGLVREGESVAARVLNRFGVDLTATRFAIEKAIGRGESTTAPSEIVLTPHTKKVIELAIDEAGGGQLATEHLLLGLMRDDRSAACQILKSWNVTLDGVRRQVAAERDGRSPDAR